MALFDAFLDASTQNCGHQVGARDVQVREVGGVGFMEVEVAFGDRAPGGDYGRFEERLGGEFRGWEVGMGEPGAEESEL